jgi:hypothetical protein
LGSGFTQIARTPLFSTTAAAAQPIPGPSRLVGDDCCGWRETAKVSATSRNVDPDAKWRTVT